MYLVEKFDRPQMAGAMFELSVAMYNLDSAIVDQADECELWGTSFSDGGADYCEYRFVKDGTVFHVQRVEGY